jgi:prophage maintenance system killer protein
VIFLELNDLQFGTDENDVVEIVEAVAAGTVTEGVVAKWIRERITEP